MSIETVDNALEGRPASATAARDGGRRSASIILICAVLLAYGYEIFNFHETLDEPSMWNRSTSERFMVWVVNGRLGAGLGTMLLPSTAVPVVPTALGLAMVTYALWVIARRHEIPAVPAAIFVSIAVTTPILIFMTVFSIGIFVVGLAHLALAVAVPWALRERTLTRFLAGTAAGAFALSTYEPMGVVLVALVALECRALPSLTSAVRPGLLLVGSIVGWRVAHVLSTFIAGPLTSYVDGQLGFDRDLSITAYARRILGLTLGDASIQGFWTPWMTVSTVLLIGMAVWRAAASADNRRRIVHAGVVGAILLSALGAPLAGNLDPRNLVYWPSTLLACAVVAWPMVESVTRRSMWRGAAIVLALLTVAGNATAINGIAHAGATLSERDSVVANQLIAELSSLNPTRGEPLSLVITRSYALDPPDNWRGRSTLNKGPLNHGLPQSVAYLRMKGMNVREPTPAERSYGESLVKTIPAYPHPNWVQIRDGILLVNAGGKTFAEEP